MSNSKWVSILHNQALWLAVLSGMLSVLVALGVITPADRDAYWGAAVTIVGLIVRNGIVASAHVQASQTDTKTPAQ